MQTVATLIILLSLLYPQQQPDPKARAQPAKSATKQLFAVRGEIVSIKKQAARMLALTIRPSKDFPEVTVIAYENDLVGSSVKRSDDVDLLGLLGDESRANETITAAELSEGDAVSVIYDPERQNRSMEIYLH
jgi:hypothetical protein